MNVTVTSHENEGVGGRCWGGRRVVGVVLTCDKHYRLRLLKLKG